MQVEKESARLLAIDFEATDGYEEDETHLKATCTDDGRASAATESPAAVRRSGPAGRSGLLRVCFT